MAGRIKATLGSLAFLVLAPGIVAGLIPWLLTGWRPLPPADGLGALRWAGLILVAAGLAVVLEAFARFAWVGLGTPAPVAPTRTLVVSGFYRFVRNPMYVAVERADLRPGRALRQLGRRPVRGRHRRRLPHIRSSL